MNLSKRTTEYIIVGVLLILSAGLILPNLGNIYLWGDEAQTALIAKTVLSHGVPVAYDGKNYFSQIGGRDLGKNYISKWLPWLQFYVLAGFFAAFGASTFTARLPFALFGIATIILTYYFAKAFWRNRRAGVLSAIVLLASVPFLLLTRQCRYYSLDAFFSLLGLYGYYGILEQRKRSGLIFTLSAILLFHSQFVHCAALLATVITHALLFQRKTLKPVLILSGIVIVASAPWVIWFSSLGREVTTFSSFATRATVFTKFMVTQTFKHIFPPLILVLPVVLFVADLVRHKRRPAESYMKRNLALLTLFAIFTIAAVSFAMPTTFFRYLAPLIPVACIIIGSIVESGMKVHPAVGVVMIGLLAWWWRMPDYLYEITHDYDGPTEGIVQYLNDHASSSDIVVANHDDMALKFYTGLRIVSTTTGEDLTPAKRADWVIMRKWADTTELNGHRYLVHNVPWNMYERLVLPYPDTDRENREDPEEHHFRTVENARPVTIYHRIGE